MSASRSRRNQRIVQFGANENSRIVSAGRYNWRQSQVVQTAFKLNFTSQIHNFLLTGRQFTDACPADAGNISDGKMPWSLKVIFCPGAGAVTSARLPESPRETLFFAKVENSASGVWGLRTAVCPSCACALPAFQQFDRRTRIISGRKRTVQFVRETQERK